MTSTEGKVFVFFIIYTTVMVSISELDRWSGFLMIIALCLIYILQVLNRIYNKIK